MIEKDERNEHAGFAEPLSLQRDCKGNTDKQDMEGGEEGVTEHEDSESTYDEKIKRILVC